MSLDDNLINGYKKVNSKADSYQKTVDAKKKSTKLAKANAQSNFDGDQGKKFSNLNEWGETADAKIAAKKKQLQDKATNQLDELVKLFSITRDKTTDETVSSGNTLGRIVKGKTIDTLVDIYNKTILNTRSRMTEIFIKEVVKTLGCSEEQEFTVSPIYIRVESLDLFKMLKENPDGAGKFIYEKSTTTNGNQPYAMNRQLWDRLQNLGTSFNTNYSADYIGASRNQIFDIEYVDQDDQGNFGNFYKVTPKSGISQVKSVTQFLYDYYMSIQMVDVDELIAHIISLLMGAFSDISITSDQAQEQSKFMKILQRALGLCFDNQKEIDVSGIAKLSVIDNIDETFFEFTNTDLRDIENLVNNIINGVTEFTDCDNVKLPINKVGIQEGLLDIQDLPTDSDKLAGLVSLLDDLADEEAWKLLLPTLDIKGKVKYDFLKVIPLAIVRTLLSPKNLLGFFTVAKMLQNTIVDAIESLADFLANFKTFIIELISKIGAIFVEELFKEIKKNIDKLVKQLLKEIQLEVKDARVKMIIGLIRGAIILTEFIQDWRRCKGVLDELLDALKLAAQSLGLPQVALALSGQLPGMTPSSMLANAIEGMEKAGLPTGDLPDGSPNRMVEAQKVSFTAMLQEMQENGKTEIFIPPLAMTPAGFTVPAKAVGKSY